MTIQTEFNEALHWLNSRTTFGIKPGLERMNYMLEQLGHPERRLKAVHVAGTNGKGSTVSFMRHILQEAGYVVGTFTSPYIESFNERISVDGIPISDEDFVEIVKKIKPIVETCGKATEYGAPTEFEVLTVIALEYFARVAVPYISLIETGLGGRLDSTNVITPLVSVITNIGQDHMNILGNTVEEITKEKAGIIKSGFPVVTAVEQPEAEQIIADVAKSKNSKLYRLGKEFKTIDTALHNGNEVFTFQSLFNRLENLEITMKGEHQVKNAATALMAIEYLKQYFAFVIDEEHIRTGLLKTTWKGRFEKVSDKPLTFIDGAHNPEGIDTLCKTIQRYYSDKKVHIIFSALKDKPLKEMIAKLDNIADKITFTQFEFNRCAEAKELFELSSSANKDINEDWQKAIESAKQEIGGIEEEILIITGSLYFISEVRKTFQ
ncbi:bifunctional folylpolyglutamate synthase/dihydrofolate synthase [Schinkia azotoformans]|uniref:bifunctional folylpolyglutamate synthase/dihydrofolate synthase n=1 Tax=Schinkia azotoformans TaxID=1454 RepID=UPI002DBE8888|nr:folylpolyglutamate synthase/dihydrofolate synthase family protein [Schinkia azotoformans]MEC1718139.1 bifunctional folylpolyglutamate synthase/dihydrofolate synthase [Schinkia azotoformans]MEC1742099.1 bifunctional folylpolyglutamate synthase/dihydrofolate synthase [Schinkia azotoformans]MEC1748033.1 bifunctional folylpolyglutamate synthase/dihydrofolate synthase [Schinkia azotoformans]MEC1765013.1 bifunctional folylpolyglutamate synthase/dihydrofolate synthase [Schinkia azotoformans]MEC178